MTEEQSGGSVREIIYGGGLASFRVPEDWTVEIDPYDGGCFYDPDSPGTLRLSVLNFARAAGSAAAVLPRARKPGERLLDGGRLPVGCEFDVYETDDVEDGDPIRTRTWRIYQALPDLVRIFIFSYSYETAQEARVQAELNLVDGEIRQMRPGPAGS
jgi:hypothetical protein